MQPRYLDLNVDLASNTGKPSGLTEFSIAPQAAISNFTTSAMNTAYGERIRRGTLFRVGEYSWLAMSEIS